MFARQSLVVFALSSLGAVAAQAEVVEMVVDVTATTRQVSHLDQGTLVTTNDASFQPQQFQWVVRFDLDQPYVTPSQPVNGDTQLYASTFFKGGSTSDTPYSAGLLSLVPPSSPVLFPDVGQVYAVLMTKDMMMPFSSAQPVDIHTGFNSGLTWQAVSDGLATTTTYGRAMSFSDTGAAIPNSAFHAWTGQEFVSYLQSQAGKTYVGGFNESFNQWVQKANPPGDVILVSNAPDALVAQDSIVISGDVSIQSVAVVPEPASYALMGLGLPLIAAALRRRRAA